MGTSDDIIHSTSPVSPLEFKSRGLHFSDISKVGGITINTKKGGRWHTDRIKNQGNSKSFGIGLKNSVLNDIRQQMRKNLNQKHFTSNIIMNTKPRGKFSRSWSTNWSSGSKGGGPKSYSRSWSTNWSSGSKGVGPKSYSRSWSSNWSSGSKGEGSKPGLNNFQLNLKVGDDKKISKGSYGVKESKGKEVDQSAEKHSLESKSEGSSKSSYSSSSSYSESKSSDSESSSEKKNDGKLEEKKIKSSYG